MKHPSLLPTLAALGLAAASAALLIPRLLAQFSSSGGSGSYSGSSGTYGSGSSPPGSGTYTSYLPSAPAASLQSASMWNFQVPLARARHVVALYWKDGSNALHPGTYTNVPGIATGTGPTGAQVPLYLAVTASPPMATSYPANLVVGDWWLVDSTASQAGPHQVLGLVNAQWRATSGVTNTYYAISSARFGHAFIASVGRHTDCGLSSFRRPRLTFSRMSEAETVQIKGFGFAL